MLSSLQEWSQKLRIELPSIAVVENTPPQPKKHVKAAKKLAEAHLENCPIHSDSELISANGLYQVKVNGHLVAALPEQQQAAQFAKQLRRILKLPGFQPDALKPGFVNGKAAGRIGKNVLFHVEPEVAAWLERSSDLIAIDWTNNLRIALGADPLTLIEAQLEMYGLTNTDEILEGTASWYGPYFHNRETATGERFNQNELTAAHPSLPFDTYLKVTNLENQESVIVRINDRGPYWGGRSLDLSLQAARCIGSEHPGVVRYEAVIMEPSVITGKAPQKSANSSPKSFQVAQQP
jgi:rare lipoprotein A